MQTVQLPGSRRLCCRALPEPQAKGEKKNQTITEAKAFPFPLMKALRGVWGSSKIVHFLHTALLMKVTLLSLEALFHPQFHVHLPDWMVQLHSTAAGCSFQL